jgi:hypothetical protein
MPEHSESIVIRLPVRNADRLPSATSPAEPRREPAPARPLVPVCEIPDLSPHERVAELRQRVVNGVYCRREVVEQVARGMVLGGKGLRSR